MVHPNDTLDFSFDCCPCPTFHRHFCGASFNMSYTLYNIHFSRGAVPHLLFACATKLEHGCVSAQWQWKRTSNNTVAMITPSSTQERFTPEAFFAILSMKGSLASHLFQRIVWMQITRFRLKCSRLGLLAEIALEFSSLLRRTRTWSKTRFRSKLLFSSAVLMLHSHLVQGLERRRCGQSGIITLA